MAQRLNKKLVVGLTIIGMLLISAAGILIAYQLPGRDPKPWLDQAEAYAQKNEYEQAGKCYARASQRAMRAGNTKDANDYLVKAGEMSLNIGDANGALKTWGAVMLSNPQHEAAQQKIVELRVEQARTYGRQFWNEVQKEAEKLCQITQNANLLGLHALGRALVESPNSQPKDLKRGEELLQKAVQQDPTHPDCAESLANAYLRLYDQFKKDTNQQGIDSGLLDTKRDEAIAQAAQVYEALLQAIEKAAITDKSIIAAAHRKRGQFHLLAREGANLEYAAKRSKRVSSGELESIVTRITKHSAEARGSFEKAIELAPQDEEILVLMGTYWRSQPSFLTDEAAKKKEIEENQLKAKDQFERAIKTNPDSFDPYLQLSDIYLQEGEAAFTRKDRATMEENLIKADKVLQERISRGSTRSGVYEWRNRSYMAIVRWQLFHLNALRLERIQQLAGTEGSQKEISALIERLRQIRKDFVADTLGGEKDHRAQFMKARLEIFEAKPFLAIETLRDLQDKLQPGDMWVRTRLFLATQCLQIDEPGPAITALQDVIKIYPTMEVALGMLARSLSFMPDRTTEAEDTAKRTLELNPANRDALTALLNVYQKQKNWKAIEQVRTALGIEPSTKDNKLYSASVLLSQDTEAETKDPEIAAKAKRLIRETLEDDPTNIQALRMLQMSGVLTNEADRQEFAELVARAQAEIDKKLQAASTGTQPGDQTEKELRNTKNTLQVLSVIARPDLSEAERIKQTELIVRQESDPFLMNIDLYRLLVGTPDRQAEAIQALKEAYRIKPDDARVVEMLFRVSISELKDANGNVTCKPDWNLASDLVKQLVKLGVDRSGGHYYQGQLYFARTDMKDNFVQAEREFREGLKAFPMHSAGYGWLGRALLSQQRFDDAQEAFYQAFHLNPRNGMAAMCLAMIADQKQDQANKQKYLQICKTLNVTNPWVVQQLQILQDHQDPIKGIARREEMRRKNPEDFNNLYQLTLLYLQQGDLSKAKELMAAVYALQPKNLVFLSQYAEFLRNMNPPASDEAEAVIRKTMDSIDAADKDQKAAAQLVLAYHLHSMLVRQLPNAPASDAVEAAFLAAASISDKPSISLDIANYYQQMGNLAKMEEFIRKAIASAQNVGDARSELASRQHLIRLMLQVKDPKRSNDILREIETYRKKSNDPAGLTFLSEYATMIGRETQAIDYVTQFIVATSGVEKALGYYRRAGMNYRRGEWDLAIADLREAKALAPSMFEYEHRILLSRCLQIVGQMDQAEAELSSILAENRGLLRAAEEVYRLYMAGKKYDEAETFLLQAYNVDPKSPKWIGLLTEVAAARGDFAKAVERAIQTVENSRYAPNLLDNLLSLQLRSKRYEDLIAYVTRKVPEDKRSDAYVLTRLAAAHFAKGDKQTATQIFGQALKSKQAAPGSLTPIILDLPLCLGKEAAIDFVSEQKANYPNEPEMGVYFAQLLYRTGEADRFAKLAEELLTKLSPADPKLVPLRVEILQSLVEVVYARKDFEGARKLHEEVLTLAPQAGAAHTITLNNLAYLLTEDMNQPKAGLQYAEQAHQLIPNQSNIMDTLGWCLIQTGDYDRGIALTRAAALTAGTLDVIQLSAIHYHAAYGLHKRSQELRKRSLVADADQDINEAKVACRRAHQLLTGAGLDENDLQAKIASLAKELGVTLQAAPQAARSQS